MAVPLRKSPSGPQPIIERSGVQTAQTAPSPSSMMTPGYVVVNMNNNDKCKVLFLRFQTNPPLVHVSPPPPLFRSFGRIFAPTTVAQG